MEVMENPLWRLLKMHYGGALQHSQDYKLYLAIDQSVLELAKLIEAGIANYHRHAIDRL